MTSLVEQLAKKAVEDHDGDSDLTRICQQFDETVETVNSARKEVTALIHTTTTRTMTEETPG